MHANGGYVDGVGYALTKLGAIAERLQLRRRRRTTAGSAGTPTSAPSAQHDAARPRTPRAARRPTCTASSPTPPTTRRCTSRSSRWTRPRAPSTWVDWNLFNDELTFAQAFRNQAVQRGLPVQHRHADRHLAQRLGRCGPADRPTTLDRSEHVHQRIAHRPAHPHGQLVQPERRRPRRAAAGGTRRRHRRLRVDQAAGRVGRFEHGDPERRGQGLRPDVRPDLRRQRRATATT